MERQGIVDALRLFLCRLDAPGLELDPVGLGGIDEKGLAVQIEQHIEGMIRGSLAHVSAYHSLTRVVKQ